MKRSPVGRRRRIIEMLSDGSVSVRSLAGRLNVSEVSIRRDLAALKREGKLLRVYGGALPNQRVAYEFSFQEKEALRRREKEAIGQAAARLVEPGAAVFLDTGTTALAVARALRKSKPRIIVTVNLCVASEYVGERDVKVLVPGGELGGASPDLLGEWALERLSNVNVDIAFLGCDSADPRDGFCAVGPESAAVARLMLSRSRKCYLIADSSKFSGAKSVCRIGPLRALKGVVTDGELAPAHRRALRRLGLDVIIAE